MKKIKLFLSLCMMCLCIAVLCIGILALNPVEYNITGSMTYNATSDLALVNTRVYKVAGTESSLSTVCSTLSTKTFEEIEQTSGYVLSQKLDTKATLSDSATQTEVSSGSISIDFGATDSSVWYYTFYIVINITNLSSFGTLSATLTDSTTYTNVNNYALSSQTGISKSDTKNLVVGLSLSDTTTVLDSLPINYSIKIEYDSRVWCTSFVNAESCTFLYVEGSTWNDLVNDSSLYKCDPDGELTYVRFYVATNTSNNVVLVNFSNSSGTYSGEIYIVGGNRDTLVSESTPLYRDA